MPPRLLPGNWRFVGDRFSTRGGRCRRVPPRRPVESSWLADSQPVLGSRSLGTDQHFPQAGAKNCGGHADSLAGDIAVPEEGCTSVRYDFRRTERFTKDQLRGLELLYEQFARQLGGTLSAYLRTTASVTPVGLEQLTYGEFIRTRAETTAEGSQPGPAKLSTISR